MRTCASGDIFRNQICQMCCLLYLGEYTQIPHLDKVPNFPSLDFWYIASHKSRHSFPPKFAPFWLGSVLMAQMWQRFQDKPSSGSNALPLLDMWHQPFKETKDTMEAPRSDILLAWLWNILGSPAEMKPNPNSQTLPHWWGPTQLTVSDQLGKKKLCKARTMNLFFNNYFKLILAFNL